MKIADAVKDAVKGNDGVKAGRCAKALYAKGFTREKVFNYAHKLSGVDKNEWESLIQQGEILNSYDEDELEKEKKKSGTRSKI